MDKSTDFFFWSDAVSWAQMHLLKVRHSALVLCIV